MLRRTAPLLAALALAAVPPAAGAHVTPTIPSTTASTEGEHSPNLTHVRTIGYQARHGETPNYGTDIEFAEIAGKRYAFAGSYRNGMQIFDITEPEHTHRVAVYDCAVTQGDVQVFRRPDLGKVLATYTSDTYGNVESKCYRDAAAKGFAVRKETTSSNNGRNGTFIVDVTDPAHPETVSFVPIGQGSHNMTVHPGGKHLYNSNSDLMTSFQPAIEVIDISDPTRPRALREVPFLPFVGVGTEAHDITFNEDGSRAYAAALSQGVILDTNDPGNPTVVSQFRDPTINVWHQSDPVTVGDREFLIVEDEFVGAIGTGQCPNGGVHVFEITGELEKAPKKVGFWNIDDVGPTSEPTHSCTAHVFDIHEDEKILTIAYYNGGVRVVDLAGLEGIGLGDQAVAGEQPMKELAFYRFEDANSWSAKTPKIQGNGDFYLYGNDIARGLDVYRFDAGKPGSTAKGRWESPEEHRARRSGQPSAGRATPLDLIREGVAGEE